MMKPLLSASRQPFCKCCRHSLSLGVLIHLTAVLEDVDFVLVVELCHVNRVDRWCWLERSPTERGPGLLVVVDLVRDHRLYLLLKPGALQKLH